MYTLLIPTYNSTNTLKLLIEYLSTCEFNFEVFILDSSEERTAQINEKLINNSSSLLKYIAYSPKISMSLKIKSALEKVSTPYVSLCADDDFVLVTNITKCLEFLKLNPEYSCVMGQTISYKVLNKNIIFKKNPLKENSIEDASVIERFKKHFSKYSTATFYGVHRTDFLYKLFSISHQTTSNCLFSEYLMTLLTIIEGKLKVFDFLYSIRLSHDLQKLKEINFYTFIMNGTFDSEYSRFERILSNAISDKTGISIFEARKIVSQALDSYLANDGLSLKMLRFKAKFKRILSTTGLLSSFLQIKRSLLKPKLRTDEDFLAQPEIPYFNPSDPDHDEFIKIKRIIERYNI